MSVILVGLNHNTAPVSLREQLSLSGCALDMALEEFRHTFMGYDSESADALRLTEGIFLSTCNRLEMYIACSSDEDVAIHQSWQYMTQFLASLQGTSIELLTEHLYFKAGTDAIQHLMRVASGLDSMILGEPQIIGQVVHAYKEAHAAHTTGPILSHLFNQAIYTGKRARTETDISRHTTSVSHAAARLASQELGGLAEKKILIVGAGEMAELAAQAMQMNGGQDITIVNRTYSSAAELATKVNGVPLPWHEFDQALIETDLVVTATGAPHVVIEQEQVEKILPQRMGRTLLFMDIAVPRDVDEKVDLLDGVVCHDVDALQATVDENMAQRQAELPKVESIIDQEVSSMLDWLSQREVVPVIIDMRTKVQQIAADEVSGAKRRLRQIDPHSAEIAEDVIERLAHRLVNKILHDPVVQLKNRAASGDGHEYAYMLRELFNIANNREIEPIGESNSEPTLEQLHAAGSNVALNQSAISSADSSTPLPALSQPSTASIELPQASLTETAERVTEGALIETVATNAQGIIIGNSGVSKPAVNQSSANPPSVNQSSANPPSLNTDMLRQTEPSNPSLLGVDSKSTIVLGTRKSILARWQTDHVMALLSENWPAKTFADQIFTTKGDKIIDVPLPLIGGKGLFTLELESALRSGDIDMAVHSLKDLPTESPGGLSIGAIPERENSADVLVSRSGQPLDKLPKGATIGTSSRRRAAQLRHYRPDLNIIDIRGNVDTRIAKTLDPDGPYDASILAYAGVHRLERDSVITEILADEIMLCAPGQGALGIQCRDDAASLALLAPIHDRVAAAEVTAERSFLAAMGGGCATPVAAKATVRGMQLFLTGRVTNLEGTRQIDLSTQGLIGEAYALGQQLATEALAQGAQEILDQCHAIQ